MKKIVVLSGSPHEQGSTAALVDAFLAGVDSSRYTCLRLDVAKMQVHPCLACDICAGGNPCVWEDDMEAVLPELFGAEVVVFATPLYYFGISAQLKLAIDRFHAKSKQLKGAVAGCLLLGVGGTDDNAETEALRQNFRLIAQHLQWPIKAELVAIGINAPEDYAGTDWLQQAHTIAETL